MLGSSAGVSLRPLVNALLLVNDPMQMASACQWLRSAVSQPSEWSEAHFQRGSIHRDSAVLMPLCQKFSVVSVLPCMQAVRYCALAVKHMSHCILNRQKSLLVIA